MVKFIAVPSFTCVHFWLVHVHYINMHLPLFFDVVFTQVHCLPTNYDDNYCRHNIVEILLSMSSDSILVPSVVRVSVPFTELHEHTYLYCFCFGTLFTNKLWESCYEIFDILLLYQILFVSVFSVVSYRNMHLPIVLCCGTGRALFTNKLSKQWCQIIKLYHCTKFCACKYLGY